VKLVDLIVLIPHSVVTLYIYYKERRQLKTFKTQIGPVLPLTPDPLIICFWKWIRWNDYEILKNRNLESVSAKNM
jgi:hypothetical protein